MFGITEVAKKELDSSLEGTEEGNENIAVNKNTDDLIRAIVSNKNVIKDDGYKHISLRFLHDKLYGLKYIRPNNPNTANYANEDLMEPMLMKPAYELIGEGCLLEKYSDEFVLEDIYKYTGITFSEWLNIIPVEQQVIIRSVRKKKELEIKANENLTKELKEQSKEIREK